MPRPVRVTWRGTLRAMTRKSHAEHQSFERLFSFIVRTNGPADDTRLQDVAWTEHQDPPWQDRNLHPGLGVASDPAALLPYRKSSEPTDFNGFSGLQPLRYRLQDKLKQIG